MKIKPCVMAAVARWWKGVLTSSMVSSTVLSRRILTNIGMRMPANAHIINIRSDIKGNRRGRMPVRTLGNGANDVEDEGAVLVAQ